VRDREGEGRGGRNWPGGPETFFQNPGQIPSKSSSGRPANFVLAENPPWRDGLESTWIDEG